jgi:molecular chaperone GrpE
MSKKIPAEKTSEAKGAAPESPAPGAPSATPAAATAAPATPATPAGPAREPACDYRALYEEANDRWLRARADFDNYRKRMQREVVESRFQVTLQVVTEFLRLHDQLRLGLEHVRSSGGAAAVREGLELIQAEFERILSSLGVSPISAVGAVFDPAVHEAIAQEPSATAPAGTVVREWKSGFVLGDRLLRPATVSVSSGPPVVATTAAEAESVAGKRQK